MTTGLSDLDSLLAELEDVDDPAKKKTQAPKKTQQPLDFGKEWDELDALVEKFETEGKKMDELEASKNPINSNKPKTTNIPPSNPHQTRTSTQSSVAPPKQTNAPVNSSQKQPTSTTNLSQNKAPPSTTPKTVPPPSQQPIKQQEPHSEGSFLMKRSAETAPRQSLSPNEVKFCAKCGQSIGKEHIMALGMGWHPEHFTCDSCGKSLKGDFFDNDGQYFCKECTDRAFRCSTCGNTIDGEYFISGSDKYHKSCYNAVQCAKCGQGITGSEMIALEKHYHAECFTCTSCNIKLPARFFSKENQPYCESCVNSMANKVLCGKCKLVITGLYISFENASYHEHCFTCGHCFKTLNVDGFFTLDGKPHCGDCAKMLTGRS